MARFAQSAMLKMTEVQQNLTPLLGNDVLELSLKVGLHSGPVTAGVLRGQKASHFQIFGDTVNTASRICSTSPSGQIHISTETATYLECFSGKKMSKIVMTPREDVVEAKGKGKLQTFYLSTTLPTDSSKERSSCSGSVAGSNAGAAAALVRKDEVLSKKTGGK